MNEHRLTTLDLTPFYKSCVGIEQILNSTISRTKHANTGNYPPYNIIAVSDEKYVVEVAIAGFEKDEISVTVENGMLQVTGNKADSSEEAGWNYVYRGISSRDFERSFVLADYVEVKGAEVVNGILRIELERILPESLKPKTIEIEFK